LFAKETSPAGYTYLGAFPNTPMDAANLLGPRTGGTQRTIFSGYVQDKIDVLEDTLHLTPGVTIQGSQASDTNDFAFAVPGCAEKYCYFQSQRWDREVLPFFNVSYDFDKILPPLKGLSVYGSFGNSALYAPVTDFGPNTAGPPPSASIVHMYEAGVKYNISNIVISADYFYQKVDRDFGYFSFQSGPETGLADYNDNGQREFKGEEAAITWQVTPSIQLFGNVSHLSAKYLTSGFAFDTVAEDQYGIELKGNPVSGIPDWLSTFGVDYSKNSVFQDSDNVNIRITGQYTGHQYTTTDYGGSDYLNQSINFLGLEPLNYKPYSCVNKATAAAEGLPTVETSCAYTRYNQITGATVTQTNGGGISPFAVFNLDATYTLPTPFLPIVKKVTFDANVQNIFNAHFFQYFYAQIPPGSCGTIKTGPLTGAAANNYSCSPEFQDGIPGQPFGVYFTVTARF
jgi:iron complex outermembrane receptor protein